MNINKYDDEYNSLNDRKKSLNANKRLSNFKNNFIGHLSHKTNNIIINTINKKNSIMMNNIKLNNNNNNFNIKKQMTIIQNFSKYKKKGALNINNNNYVKNNCHNENMSNNYEDNKIIIQGNDNKKIKNLNIVNKTIDEKRKTNEYNHSQNKIIDQSNNCYTN